GPRRSSTAGTRSSRASTDTRPRIAATRSSRSSPTAIGGSTSWDRRSPPRTRGARRARSTLVRRHRVPRACSTTSPTSPEPLPASFRKRAGATMFRVTDNAEELPEVLAGFDQQLADARRESLARAVTAGAEEARTNHRFQSRTGATVAGIQGYVTVSTQ